MSVTGSGQQSGDRFVRCLARRGIEVHAAGGVWVPVLSESGALVHLATHGIGVAPGSSFMIDNGPPHLRISTAGLDDTLENVAEQVAIAATARRAKS